jgi:exonuclease VII small subunit
MSLESITQAIRNEISKLNQVLRLLEGGAKVKQAPRRKMSAAARKRISLAQKARWKKVRAGRG